MFPLRSGHSIKNWILWIGLLLVIAVQAQIGLAGAKKYETYVVDYKPFEKHPELYKEFKHLIRPGYNSHTPEEFKRLYEITLQINKLEPEWVDGYWMVGSAAFQYGSIFVDERFHKQARKIFVTGLDVSRKCHQKWPQNPICMNFLAALIGQVATIDGVFSSLKKGKEVERLWQTAINSKYNFNFTPEVSMQGSMRYGLGLFYRIVPDFFLLDWLFGIRGSLAKSIQYHKESISIDPTNPCADMMLAVALLCHSKDKRGDPETIEGHQLLDKLIASKHEMLIQQVCINDARKIKKDTGLACGYMTAKQQDIDPAKLEKLVEEGKSKK
jgi:hypothetical protein